jgi:hypothetical protein
MLCRAGVQRPHRTEVQKVEKIRGFTLFASALLRLCISAFLCLTVVSPLSAFTDSDVATYQKEIAGKPLGERIALWAERFVGTLYDPDPLGEYVTKRSIVADDRVDCMYLSFRALELALSHTPEEAVRIALDKRFLNKGELGDGVVLNYDDRFQYGEDMLDSGKWGRDITGEIGSGSYVEGSRGRGKVMIISKKELMKKVGEKGTVALKSGDFIFFIKAPEKRALDEIVGHIGIIRMEGSTPYLIHAGGRKNNGGKVKKVLLYDYVRSMSFAGVKVGRFPDP